MPSRRPIARREFEQAALPHIDALYGVAYRLTRNRGDAEDLVQEALLRAYRFWHTFEQGSNCKAWLLKILTNTFFNTHHKRKREREVLDQATAEQSATDGVLHHERALAHRDPEGALIDRMISDDVARALESLPPEFRVAVVLCDIEGLSYKEIAEVMECPIGTVMSRLYRGRRLLQKALYDYAVEQGIIRRPSDTPDNMVELETYRSKR
ncbi:MAG: sigma-70 family RNA polymerase sigma factor [Deltaproteobacteria bacterium]|nr:MAG: sigma-70 family RNA polymerase sigma factor [Deltaproteobacteria bacterium]